MEDNQFLYENTLLEIESSTKLYEVIKAIENHPNVKKFKWRFKGKLSESNLIEVLNLMPQLQVFKFIFCDTQTECEIKFRKFNSTKLNLPHLTKLRVFSQDPFSIFKFFTRNLSKNQLKALAFSNCYRNIDLCAENINDFFRSQKSIKKVKTSSSDLLKYIKILNLDELELIDIRFMDPSLNDSFLTYQRSLKKLICPDAKWPNDLCDNLSKLTKLEVLDITIPNKNVQKLVTLKNLRDVKLAIQNVDEGEDFEQKFFLLQLDKLEKLSLSHNHAVVKSEHFDRFSNVTFLDIRTFQKLNFIAKKLPKLEHLRVGFEGNNICETDTGIVNKNLRKLEMDLLEFSENFYTILEMFPNLEEIKVSDFYGYESLVDDENLFKKLIKAKSLKSITISNFHLNNDEEFLEEISKDLHKLHMKIQDIHICFEYKSWMRKTSNLMDSIKDSFEIKCSFKHDCHHFLFRGDLSLIEDVGYSCYGSLIFYEYCCIMEIVSKNMQDKGFVK